MISDQDEQLIEKALKDPLFGSAFRAHQSVDLLKQSGFFNDNTPDDYDYTSTGTPNWLTTPTHKLILPTQSKTKNIVLLATGAFAPLHEGHIAMMEAAKQACEEQGYFVMGGYLSPSHDIYLNRKIENTTSAAERVFFAQQTIQHHPWLMIDPWEAIYNSFEVTYSTVISRLKSYLEKHISSSDAIKVAYVFGSDNAAFAFAFLEKGMAVCIERPGYEELAKQIFQDERIANRKNILFYTNGMLPKISSTEIRNSLKHNSSDELFDISKPSSSKPFVIRNEEELIFSLWKQGRDISLLRDAQEKFICDLQNLFETVFQNESEKNDASISIVRAKDQCDQTNKLFANKKTISLDPCFAGTYALNISRQFQLADGQFTGTQLIPRPGFLSLDEQIASITDGEYVVVDDDISSGQTMDLLKTQLPDRIQIVGTYALTNLTKTSQYYDIVDARDFLPGAWQGGLVIQLPNKERVRAPYMMPYVSLSTRAKIPASQEQEVSKALWKIARNFFAQVTPAIKLSETEKTFQILMSSIGFEDNALMTEICDWHLKRLV